MKNLTELANKYGTDKGTMSYGHGYSVIYNELFKDWQDKSIKLLEIGVCDPRFPGASLKMWEEYFFNGKIIGLDINPEALNFTSDRINIWIEDQNNYGNLILLAWVGYPSFDIIIDDGSHVGEHILTSFKALWSSVKPGGYYIIEDLHSAYTNAEETVSKLKTFIKDEKLDVDISHLHDGKLIVMRKPS